MTFKVGDKVKFTKLLMADSNYFSTGKVYTITNCYLDMKDTYLLNDILLYAYGHQLKKVIEDNPINRLLYPELKPKDGILE
jgi:hypothetical protein